MTPDLWDSAVAPLRLDRYDARTILTPTRGFLGPHDRPGFTHTLNPAVGCPYGRGLCGAFCYARLGLAQTFNGGGPWGESLRIKRNAAALLDAELRRAARRPSDHPLHVARLRIFASSSTDPCAGPVLDVFRACLEVLAHHAIDRIVIQTRAPQVLRLREPIEALGRRALVSFTLETDDESVWARGPRGSPGVAVRRRAIEHLSSWSTRLNVAVSPCLPLRDPGPFAHWIANVADYATVDSFCAGDGSGGSRTARLPLPQIYERNGWDWRDESAARSLYEALRNRMGQRAGWSQAGFAQLATA